MKRPVFLVSLIPEDVCSCHGFVVVTAIYQTLSIWTCSYEGHATSSTMYRTLVKVTNHKIMVILHD